jgi:hypothetical protein
MILRDSEDIKAETLDIYSKLECQANISRLKLTTCTANKVNESLLFNAKLAKKPYSPLLVRNPTEYQTFRDIIDNNRAKSPLYKGGFKAFSDKLNSCINTSITRTKDAATAREDAIKQKKTEAEITEIYKEKCTPKDQVNEMKSFCAEAELISVYNKNDENGDLIKNENGQAKDFEEPINSGYFSYVKYDQKSDQFIFNWDIKGITDGSNDKNTIASSAESLKALKDLFAKKNDPNPIDKVTNIKIKCRAIDVIEDESFYSRDKKLMLLKPPPEEIKE